MRTFSAALILAAPLLAQQITPPASFPHDMTNYGCTHYDDKACDQAPTPPPDYSPLTGTWVRFSLLRNGFTQQPPSAPLYVKFSSDGYWSMMEFSAGRPKLDKPLEKHTPQELMVRFDKLAGGWGNYTQNGMVNLRHHLMGLGPGDEENTQAREWVFEGNVLVLSGTGVVKSPQARFRKLPNQPLGTKALAGTWERTSFSVAGAAVQSAPQHLILGEDGWFHETLLPKGRTSPAGKPREKWTTEDYVAAYRGMSAARGTYNATNNAIIRKHIADTDPFYEGKDDVATYTMQGAVMTVQGTGVDGRKYEAKYQRMKPFDVYAPPPAPRAAAAKPAP